MSIATERRAMKDVLAGHSLMSTAEVAQLLDMDVSGVQGLIRQGKIPAVNRGTKTRPYHGVDPMDAVVFVLAERAGTTVDQYWRKHGNEAADHARDYLDRIRRYGR